jgi:hypothetical protein
LREVDGSQCDYCVLSVSFHDGGEGGGDHSDDVEAATPSLNLVTSTENELDVNRLMIRFPFANSTKICAFSHCQLLCR